MGYYDIAKNLLEFAQRLFGLGETISKSRREERERLAMYLEKIAAVVDSIRESFEKGEKPDSDCAELDEYVHTLTQVLEPHLPDDAARFKRVLHGGALARGLLFVIQDAGSREAAFDDLNREPDSQPKTRKGLNSPVDRAAAARGAAPVSRATAH